MRVLLLPAHADVQGPERGVPYTAGAMNRAAFEDIARRLGIPEEGVEQLLQSLDTAEPGVCVWMG